MAYTLIDSNEFGFRDGDPGHVCDLGTAPDVGEWDILCVNSDTIVQTPSGFTADPTAVNSQGAYIFRRKAVGGEGSTVTVDTNGNHNTLVNWSRWSGADAFDVGAATLADGSGAALTPAHSTGALAETGELVIAFAALHGGAAAPVSPVWSSGFTQFQSADYWPGVGERVDSLIAYNDNAGTAAEAPQVTWSVNNFIDRYMLTAAFTAADEDAGAGARFMSFF